MAKATVFFILFGWACVATAFPAAAKTTAAKPAPKAAGSTVRAESKEVAVVDLQRVFEHFVRLENLSQRLGEKGRVASGDVAKRVRRLSALQEQERQLRASAGPRPDVADRARLDGMAEEIRFLQEEAGVLIRDKAQEITDRERIWSTELLTAISDHIRRLAAAERLYLVLDRGPWMLSVLPRVDLTERIIRNLERERGNLRFQ
ncbi:MAG: OmpH family outer membrane protein [Spirochaetes bacterium]|nr:OmpH family outer membrane protein [Spirochaetota bacterium]